MTPPRPTSVRTLSLAAAAVVLAACQDVPDRTPFVPDPEPRFGEAVEQVITGRSFEFEIEGKAIPIIAVDPGAFRCELKDGTMGMRNSDSKAFTCPEPEFDAWRVEKYYDEGDLTLKRLFEAFAQGDEDVEGSATARLEYDDGEDGDRDGPANVAGPAGGPSTGAAGVPVRTLTFIGPGLLDHRTEVDEEGRPLEVVEFSVRRMGVTALPEAVPVVHGDTDCWLADGPARGRFGNGGPRTVRELGGVGAFDVDVRTAAGDGIADDFHLAAGGGLHCACPFSHLVDPDPKALLRDARRPTARIRLRGPMLSSAGRAALLEWLNAWMGGRAPDASLEVRMLDAPGGDVVASRAFHDLVPVRFDPPAVRAGERGPPFEEIVLDAVRLEDAVPPHGGGRGKGGGR